MNTAGSIKQGFYFDSVSLMRLGKQLSALPGVEEASVVMATESNKSILDMSGLLFPSFKKASDQDLCIAVRAKDQAACDAAMKKAEELLAKRKKTDAHAPAAAPQPRDIPSALAALPDANLALISVAGRYAAREARKALQHHLNVMLFSDNVSIEDELSLKKFAHRNGLLVMGPDCGTAIIQGVPLAFANAVPQGHIGIVGASGTGIQEVSCIIANEGEGVSQAIGTGGRDVKDAIGGISFLDALAYLANDPHTTAILLLSKPPQPAVMRKITAAARKIKKPLVSLFLGAGTNPRTLEEAALQTIALARGQSPDALLPRLERRDAALKKKALTLIARRKKPKGRYLRGLFSGGTFCAESQVVLENLIRKLYSNAPIGATAKLKNNWKPQRNSLIDLGEDEFTVGRPHPMIDFSLRNKMIAEQAANPETACILLDVVLGYGANPSPAEELAPVIASAARQVFVVTALIGTPADPQHRDHVEKILRRAGAAVETTNAAACRLAGHITAEMLRRTH